MSAKMPIAQTVLSGAATTTDWFGGRLAGTAMGESVSRAVNESMVAAIRGSIPFDVQVASELYWKGKQHYYSLESDFGPVRLPYPKVWMEWEVPEQFVDENGSHTLPTRLRFAAHLFETVKDGGQTTITCQMAVFLPEFRTVLLHEGHVVFDIDADGRYVSGTFKVSHAENLPEFARDGATRDLSGNVMVACMALNLINCKNVTTAEAGNIAVRRDGTSKRRGEDPMKFHTIILPGTLTPRERRQRGRAPVQDVMPMHRVRGHFKTFTAEAPLLGMHTGTYWWGWQVRGNKEKGIVVSDYKVGVA